MCAQNDGRLISSKRSDVSTIKLLLKIVGWLHQDFNFEWLLEDLRETLAQELDFINEGINSERCAKFLSKFSFIYVPEVLWNLSTKRILTTEFIHGTKISNVESLRKQGFSLADIDKKLFKAFAEQLFHTGFVPADPHPGNVFVRKAADGKAELVLLDHGLYECLRPSVRQSLCHLLIAVVKNDQSAIKTHASELGLEDNSELIKILTERPLNAGMKFVTRLRGEDRTEMAQRQVMKALHSMPRSMVLVMRTLHIIQAIAKDHGDPVDWKVEFVRSAFRGRQRMCTFKDILLFEFRLWWLGAKVKCIHLYFMLLAFWRNEDK